MWIVRLAVLCIAALVISSCAVPFYWQAIGGQVELLRKRRPIEELLGDPAADPQLKHTLGAVAEIRRFAVTELKLPDNDSYKTYVELDRPYVVWNVVATKEFSVDPERSCFPFVGCVGYRGFFDRARAERYEAKLKTRGLDTYSGGSNAYSTLGYFADPVLSTMVSGGEHYVASLLFHELAHQKIYIKSDSEFSEAFASAIEEYGMQRWFETHGTVDDLERYHRRQQRRAVFAELIARQQRRLRAIYASGDPPEVMRAAKEAAFATLREEYAASKAEWGGNTDYDAWFAQPLNNATLAAVATYTRWVPALRARLDVVGVEAFYREAEELAELDATERRERLRAWQPPLEAVSALR